MESFYESVITEAKSWAQARSSEELQTEEYFNEVYSNIKLNPPFLDKDNISVNLGQQVMTFENVPPGVSFYPGEKMDYASFGIPVKGDVKIFEDKFKQMLINNPKTSRFINQVLYITEYSTTPLEGNDKAIENIKNIVRLKVKNIEDALNTLKQEIEGFNNSTLKTEIRDAAKKELEKRNLKSDTIEKLKLF